MASELEMMTRAAILGGWLAAVPLVAPAQVPSTVDTSKIGPQVGQAVPPIAGVDQFGRQHSLTSIYGPKGAMLVFFRSADW
jgi:hypothetical protein